LKSLQPTAARQDTLRAVLDAVQAGRFGQAANLAETAMASGFEHPLLLNALAVGLEEQGRLPEAEHLLRRAVGLAPDDMGSLNALGLCLMRMERPEEALAQFDRLLHLDPRLPFGHVNRGNALRALGAVTDAEACYQQALAIEPNQGMALAGLAQIAANRGAYPGARVNAEKALRLLPNLPDAVMSLAAAELGERQTSRAEARVRQLLGDVRLSPVERAHASGLLGDILDAEDRTVEAIAAYTECNQALKRLNAGRFSGPSALDYVRAMTQGFDDDLAAAWRIGVPPRQPSPAAGHVFLLGFPRSGTTLLEVILEGHPDVVSLEENESLIDAVREFMRRPEDMRQMTLATPAKLDSLRASYWRRVAEKGIDVTGKVFVDKHPLNTLKLPLIAKLFPAAKILIACRDPRDIVLSCFRHRFRMSAPIFELLSIEGAAEYYDAVMRFLIRVTSTQPLDTCLVRHEDVVTEFAREMRRICAFIGIAWAPGMGDFALRTQKRAVLTPSTAQLVRGLSTEGVGHWRRYRQQLASVMPRLEPWVGRFCYDP
jgi:tetratricopeptide (TPR) repeat protein